MVPVPSGKRERSFYMPTAKDWADKRSPSLAELEELAALAGPLRVGSRVRISQPRLPDALWIITEWVEGQRFVWETNGFGLWTAATHSLLELPEETTLHLEIEQAGLLSVPVGLAFGPLTNRYLDWESQGFKKRAEAVG